MKTKGGGREASAKLFYAGMKQGLSYVILFSGKKFSALTPQNGVQIRIVQLASILARGKLYLSCFLATDKKSYCMAAKPAE